MIPTILFAVTLLICVINLLHILSIMTGRTIEFPHFKGIGPTAWVFFYPSAVYQAIYWAPTIMSGAILYP